MAICSELGLYEDGMVRRMAGLEATEEGSRSRLDEVREAGAATTKAKRCHRNWAPNNADGRRSHALSTCLPDIPSLLKAQACVATLSHAAQTAWLPGIPLFAESH